ncbi:MAG: hypothetical protein SGI87_08745 [Flavobacteriales bacterium]|nr:hypothetical protein [Flavobacteriales bacterium]
MEPNFEFEDFNGERLKDIRVHCVSNTPSVQNLLLFDPRIDNFVEVADFYRYPAPEAIVVTKYFYSYHKSGCADMNWDSDLFYIENFKTVCSGNISGKWCEREEKGFS